MYRYVIKVIIYFLYRDFSSNTGSNIVNGAGKRVFEIVARKHVHIS